MINDHLRCSEEILYCVKKRNDVKLYPYDMLTGECITKWKDTAAIGYRHPITKEAWKVFAGDRISLELANALLVKDLEEFEDCIHRAIIVPLGQNQFDALILLCMDIGKSQFRQSSVVRLINDPSAVTPYTSLEAAWKAYRRGNLSDEIFAIHRNTEWAIWKLGFNKYA